MNHRLYNVEDAASFYASSTDEKDNQKIVYYIWARQ